MKENWSSAVANVKGAPSEESSVLDMVVVATPGQLDQKHVLER